MRCTCILLFSFVVTAAGFAAESAEGAGDARLREALRNAMLQLRAAEAEKATLQSAQAALADEKKALNDKFEALRKQTVADRAATDKSISDLKTQLAAQTTEIAAMKESAEKWEALQKQAAALADSKEKDRAKLAADIVVLERKVADREAKNLALFKTANEILTRYEKFSLGEALSAREPFVGSTRAKLENLVQDFQDKLSENRVKP
jgi:chromosome segregation ATPase